MQRQSGRRLRESMEAGRRGNEGEVEERSETFWLQTYEMLYSLVLLWRRRLMKGVGASKVARRTPWIGRLRDKKGNEQILQP